MIEEVHFWKLVRDASGNIQTWQLVDINPAAAKSWGMSREEVIGKTADEIFTTATELFMPIVVKIFTEKTPHSWETYFPDLNKHLKMTSVPFGEYFFTTGSDVTQIKEAQQKAGMFEALVNNSTDFIGISDNTGTPVYVNAAGRRIVDLPLDYPIETTTIHEYYAERERKFVEDVIIKEMAEKGHWSGETYLRNFQTNEPIPVSDTHFRIEDPDDGTLIGYGTITRDIRKTKEMESKLISAKEEAERANNAKSEFLASMSHDLRTPLTAIVGYSEAINARLFGPIGDPRYEEYAKIIQDSGRFLVSLVDDILDLSRIEAERYDLLEETIDIQNIIEDTTNMVRHKAMDKKIEITSSHPHDLPHFIGDKKAITQIFNNILSNALKFTQDGGKVSIETLFQEQRGLIIQFADNGIGMSCQELAEVMEPFERGNSQIARKSEGTGLGLFLSKRLTVLHGGEMLIRSKPAQGTTVTITFPSERAIVAGD